MRVMPKFLLIVLILVGCGSETKDDSAAVRNDTEPSGSCIQSGRFGNDPLRYPNSQDISVFVTNCKQDLPHSKIKKVLKKNCSSADQEFSAKSCPTKLLTSKCVYERLDSAVEYLFYTPDHITLNKIEVICEESMGTFKKVE